MEGIHRCTNLKGKGILKWFGSIGLLLAWCLLFGGRAPEPRGQASLRQEPMAAQAPAHLLASPEAAAANAIPPSAQASSAQQLPKLQHAAHPAINTKPTRPISQHKSVFANLASLGAALTMGAWLLRRSLSKRRRTKRGILNQASLFGDGEAKCCDGWFEFWRRQV